VKLIHTYREEAKALKNLDRFEDNKSVGWRSPSNIALVKYWGKRSVQIPRNPSISFALEKSVTETIVDFSFKQTQGISVELIFEGERNKAFENRIRLYLESIIEFLPFVTNLNLKIVSKNSFPHSAGIASSASAMSALALCLVSIEQDLFGTLKSDKDFFEKASFLARLGSGSAARSVYGNYSVWGQSSFVSNSSNEISISYDKSIHPEFLTLGDAILITDSKSKKVSSTMGHELMEDHPYAEARYRQANENIGKLLNTLESNNEQLFSDIIENEALSLHALMMSSNNGYSLLNKNTWEIIQKIRTFRKDSNTFAAFTLDAGPNVHLIYKLKDKSKIEKFIKNELIAYCENENWIDDEMGTGPEKLN
jgi:diphosphomevalonate decarboxylase